MLFIAVASIIVAILAFFLWLSTEKHKYYKTCLEITDSLVNSYVRAAQAHDAYIESLQRIIDIQSRLIEINEQQVAYQEQLLRIKDAKLRWMVYEREVTERCKQPLLPTPVV